MLTQKRIVRPERVDGSTVLPEVLGRDTLGKGVLGRWSQPPSSSGAGISVGNGKAWDCSVSTCVNIQWL